jgi:hypothetical protein
MEYEPYDFRRGRAGRETAKAMLVLVAIFVVVFEPFLVIASPGMIGPMMYEPPLWAELLPWAGYLGQLVGLAWMVRIYRKTFDPEPDQHAWRSLER